MGQKSSERTIRNLLSFADIEINGPRPWDIQVHNPRFYQRVLSETALGLGESYMDGWWDCEALDEFINKVLRARLEDHVTGNWKILFLTLRAKIINLQSPKRSYEVGEKHYDLSNELYQAMLDKRMNYTCAYWSNAETLDAAQEAKLKLVCKKLNLKPGMNVLELGCGWGSFAKYAAEKYHVKILGVTVSKEQVELGAQLCAGLPVELRLQDYRDVDGKYDAVISIGILEHVGYKNYKTYMQVVDRCLKDDGIAFIHTIGRNDSSISANAWITKYIFPNGMLPSITQISHALEKIFVIEDLHNIGPHYDKTLMAWYDNFSKAWPQLKKNFDERFYRMWRYYLLSCAGGFRSRDQQLWQIVMTKVGGEQPACRFN